MDSEYVVRWGDGEMFRSKSIRDVMGQLTLALMRGYSEVRVTIERECVNLNG